MTKRYGFGLWIKFYLAIFIQILFSIPLIHFSFADICIVSSILWYWSKKCTALWKISIRSKKKSGSFGFGSNDIWRAKHDWAHGATDSDPYAVIDSVSTCSGELGKANKNVFYGGLMAFCFNRYCWFMRLLRAVSQEFLISKLTMLVKKRIAHALHRLNQDSP